MHKYSLFKNSRNNLFIIPTSKILKNVKGAFKPWTGKSTSNLFVLTATGVHEAIEIIDSGGKIILISLISKNFLIH